MVARNSVQLGSVHLRQQRGLRELVDHVIRLRLELRAHGRQHEEPVVGRLRQAGRVEQLADARSGDDDGWEPDDAIDEEVE